jgi:hypothetical protein
LLRRQKTGEQRKQEGESREAAQAARGMREEKPSSFPNMMRSIR